LKKLPIILLILIGLLSSCFDDADCISTTTDVLSISFRKYETNEVDTVEIVGITLAGADSVFNPKDTTTFIILPLDPNVSSISMSFSFETVQHELQLDYTTTPRLISPDCGVELLYDNLTINNYDFDSVAVKTRSLNEEIIPHLVIYQ